MKCKCLIICMLSVFVFTSAFTQTSKYKDGTFEGKSKAIYHSENFWGNVKITFKTGKITLVEFKIVDQTTGEIFDSQYEKHYVGNNEYIQQCRKDWKGVQTYPNKLLETQDIKKVDGVSGATWSYNLFRYAVDEALKNAVK